MTMTDERTTAFRSGFLGRLLEPADADFEETRRVHNGLIDRRPSLIACCRNTADVVDAVNYAREAGLEISVRGGGHNVAGRAVTEGGLMIDLAPMKAVLVDPVAKVARAQPGVTWKEFNRETQLHGLAVTGGVVSSTGISGLTLGGGFGWLMGTLGMAVDNLISAEVVTATGEVVQASAEQNPDLFWGIRGGGGNFGVVTSFTYRLHEVGPTVIGGLVAFPFDQAAQVIRAYREFTSSVPDELTIFAAMTHAPDGSGMKICALPMCYTGPAERSEELLAHEKAFGTPLVEQVGPIPYSALNSMLDDGFPKGALNYWKGHFLRELTDDAIDAAVARFSETPSAMSAMVIEHFHGAVTRVPVDATAFPHRSTGFNLAIAGQWADPADSEHNKTWVRETHAALEPFLAEGRYVNYLNDEESGDVPQAYGPVYDRLREVKARWDPQNLFHLNQNITPA